MEAWEVTWQDARGAEQRREFPTFLEAWAYNEQELRGRGEVVLLTDQPLSGERAPRSEAEGARRREGTGRRSRRKRS